MSQRELLLARPRPFDEFPIRIVDDTEARKEVEQARTLLHILQIQGDAADASAVRKARAALKRAEANLKACYTFITLRAMEPDEFEALIGKHKPREGTDDKVWNVDTFPKACLLACVESDMSEQDWERFWKTGLSNAERADFCNAAIRVNARTPDSSLPKGWTQIEG